jgi:hypothetical protein
MNLILHKSDHGCLAEVYSENRVITEVQDALELIAEAGQQEAEGIILYEHQITADFFRLGTGLAGEILQKFSNYRMKLAIIGNFSEYNSKSLRDFIFESNKRGQVVFLSGLEEALKKLLEQKLI